MLAFVLSSLRTMGKEKIIEVFFCNTPPPPAQNEQGLLFLESMLLRS